MWRCVSLIPRRAVPSIAVVSLRVTRCSAVVVPRASTQRALSTSHHRTVTVGIGDVGVTVPVPSRAEAVLVPPTRNEHALDASFVTHSHEGLLHLQWMLRKESLGQDMLLIGPPGSLRRELALQFCHLIQRPVEYVAITRDTTESDLKQRREILGNNSIFVDQAAVRAAIHGRVLLLDGYARVHDPNATINQADADAAQTS